MSFLKLQITRSAFVHALIATLPAFAQTFEIDNFTIDAGGAMTISTGAFELSGTIAQPDAGTLPEAGFTLEGGFWPGNAVACPHLADMNHDRKIDGEDISLFVSCEMLPGMGCECADLDENEYIDFVDLDLFVDQLLVPM